MKKKATTRWAKATSRQPTLNFPTSSDADLVAESTAAVTSTKSGATNRRARTADFADDTDKPNETNGDSSVPVSSAPTERNKIAQGKKRSAAALGQHPSTTASPEGATEPSSSAKNRRKRTADDADKHNKAHCDSSAISAQSAVENVLTDPSQENVSLPNGWRWMKAREVGEINLGRQRSPKHLSADFPTKYLRAANITETGLDLSDVLEMDFKPAEKERYQLRAGDILISEASGSAAQVGKPAIWNDELPMCCFQNTVIRLRPNAVSSKYLLWLFTHFYRNGVFACVAGGVGINHLSASKFSELSLPIAPPAEQHRIVAEIEKQFTRLDAGVAALKRVQANLKRYRAAVLKAACKGKLVPTEAELARQEGRTYETGEQLLQRILAERQQNWHGLGKYKAPFAPDNARVGNLPAGWTWATLDQLCDKITDGEHLSPKTTSRGVCLLSAKDVREAGVQLNDPKFVSSEDAEQFRKRCNPAKGDVLIVSQGATIGRICVVQIYDIFCLMGSVILLKPNLAISGKFLSICLTDRRARVILGLLSGSTAQQAIYIRDIRPFAIPLPPLAEQTRIVAEVERRLSVVDELDAVVSVNLQRANRLRQSILQRAFTGELKT